MTAICLHGHAYQPPRADPHTGAVPVEPAAAPFRDWNHRITAECYAPCTATRLHDDTGRITAIVNLFERMSFDLGPTLAHWMQDQAPDVLARIVAGDRAGRTAVAHPYHHVILPLAAAEDARTELCWGLADFRHRFGREADGMWLPETGVDGRTLSQLAELAIRFTILAPHQVRHAPPAGTLGRVGTSGPTLVVYDGPTSHALAFGAALGSAEALAERLASAAGGGLAVAATDLETFGHHHRFSERAVGHALFEKVAERGLRTGGLAGLIDGLDHVDVGTVLESAWSCAHGVERWRDACGCSSDGGLLSHQRWRAPLRDALDVLRDDAVVTFVRRGIEVFHHPMEARDAFGTVLADPAAWDEFADAHVRPFASLEEARLLLDSQEATLASFTSCAWFFADVARPEVAIVLQEAARSVELLRALGEQPPVEAALDALDGAEGVAGGVGGRALWAWARAERAASADEPPWSGRWDAERPVATVVTDLSRAAAAGATGAADQAVAVVELTRRAGDAESFRTAQEVVHDALAGRGRDAEPPLRLLGEVLGLATDVIVAH